MRQLWQGIAWVYVVEVLLRIRVGTIPVFWVGWKQEWIDPTYAWPLWLPGVLWGAVGLWRLRGRLSKALRLRIVIGSVGVALILVANYAADRALKRSHAAWHAEVSKDSALPQTLPADFSHWDPRTQAPISMKRPLQLIGITGSPDITPRTHNVRPQ